MKTRSSFYLRPGEEPPEDRNDAVALVSFADFFDGALRLLLITHFLTPESNSRYTFEPPSSFP